MKQHKQCIKTVIILAFTTLPNFAAKNSAIHTIEQKKQNETITQKYTLISKTDLYNHIAFKESSNRYNVSNQLNMLGKYQASKRALLDFGYQEKLIDSIHKTIYTDTLTNGRVVYYFDTTLFTPAEQERFIRWYVKRMEHVHLKHTIQTYVGKEIDGVRITKAGILFASMLGFGYVKKYLETEGTYNFQDANGTSIKERLLEFKDTEIIS
ncbi:MAG: hypothetical protein R6U95_02145 [Bacteroidales bacterium]